MAPRLFSNCEICLTRAASRGRIPEKMNNQQRKTSLSEGEACGGRAASDKLLFSSNRMDHDGRNQPSVMKTKARNKLAEAISPRNSVTGPCVTAYGPW